MDTLTLVFLVIGAFVLVFSTIIIILAVAGVFKQTEEEIIISFPDECPAVSKFDQISAISGPRGPTLFGANVFASPHGFLLATTNGINQVEEFVIFRNQNGKYRKW